MEAVRRSAGPAWEAELPQVDWSWVEGERKRFAQEVEPPQVPAEFAALGPVLVPPTEGPVYFMEWFLDRVVPGPYPVPGGERVQVHNLAISRAPGVVLDEDGVAHVRFTSDKKLVGGRVDYGVRLRGFGVPQRTLRKVALIQRAESDLPSLDRGANRVWRRDGWQAQVPLRKLLTPKYDVEKTRNGGRGILAIRLRLLDPTKQSERVQDLDIHYRCRTLPCRAGSPIVQLPSFHNGPVVDLVEATGAVVSFETDVPTRARVVVRGPEDEVRRFDSAQTSGRHEIGLSGLSPDRAYRYLVLVRDGRGETTEATEGAFRTAGTDPDRPFRFAVMSDSRAGVGSPEQSYRGSNRAALRDLSQWIWLRDNAFVVFAGDLINGYTTEPGAYRHELGGFIESVQPFASRVPFYEGIGNHELLMEAYASGFHNDLRGPINTESIFAEMFVNPTNAPAAKEGEPTYQESVYSFDRGPVHVAMLNTNYFFRSHIERDDHPRHGSGVREGYLTDAQLEWLDRDLAQARERGARHLFVFTHEPAFPAAGHVDDAMYWNGEIPQVLERRDAFWKVLVQHQVLAAFFGDEHAYTRSLIDDSVNPEFTLPIHHVVSGGAGAPYYALDETVPWRQAIQVFQPQIHYCEVQVDGDRVRLQVINRLGQVIDDVDLTARSPG